MRSAAILDVCPIKMADVHITVSILTGAEKFSEISFTSLTWREREREREREKARERDR